MSGPDNRSEEEKLADARRQAEVRGQVNLDTSKSFVKWILGLWAKFAFGCLIAIVLVVVISCNVISGLLRH